MTASSSSSQRSGVIAPYGGTLVDLMVSATEHAALKASATTSIECSDRNACDVELLVVGGFSPERGFMHQSDYDSVVAGHRTTSGYLFGLPIVMDTDREDVAVGDKVLLTYKGQDLAVLTVGDKWEPCKTPAEVRAGLPDGEDVVAFQCRNPIHRAHYELFTRALHAQNVSENAVVLVHPTCGPTQQDDIPGAVRFQTYERLAAEVENASIRWAYLPYAMHMAGPREALQHMIIRRNYGCTHFIIGRDMAGCKSSLSGDDFYGPYDAQNFAKECAPELTMETVPSLNLVFTDEEGYVTAEHAEARGLHVKKLSGTQFRKMLRSGEEIPEWFAFRSVVEVLRAS